MSAVAAPHAPAGTTTPPPVGGVAPTPYRWTIAEYRKLGETGLFHDKKTMLLDGVLYVMVMPNPPHDTSLTLAFNFLLANCPAGHYVRNQQGFDIGLRNDPGPDLAIVVGSVRDYAKKTPTTAIMVVEVSDSTLLIDTTKKAELYATAGVPEYWVIDLQHQQLVVFRDPQPLPTNLGATAYRTHFTLGPTDRVSPLAMPAASVLVADLLP